jgi:hypothetical protein
MVSVGLRHVPVLEDMIGKGEETHIKTDRWAKIGDDPRVLTYRHMDPNVYRDLELKLVAARRFHDEVRFAAMRDGVSVGQMMAASGLGGGAAVPSDIVGSHDAAVDKSIAMDEAARREAIEKSNAKIEEVRRQAADAMDNEHSKSASHQMRDAGYNVGAVTAGVLGAPGILADLTGYMTGRTAEDATHLVQAAAGVVSDARNAAARHDAKMYKHKMPTHLGRQEA